MTLTTTCTVSDKVAEITNTLHASEVLAEQITRNDASFLAALLNGELVGNAFALERDNIVRLQRLDVLPSFQRQGIGEMLLAKVIERFPGAARIQVTVEARNAKGLSFYKRHGFVVSDEAADDGSRKSRMEKALSHGRTSG